MEKQKILVAEDEVIISMNLEGTLSSLGYDVIATVRTAEDAIEKTELLRPDLVLMDITLAGQMDGIDAAHIIREKTDIPVIFSSAHLDASRLQRSKHAMPFGYILKPIQERDLRITLEMSLFLAETQKIKKQAESVQRLATIVKDSNDAITLQDFDGNILAWNKGAEGMYGYTENEALQMNINEIVPNNKVEEGSLFVGKLQEEEEEEEEVESFETQRVTKDGRVLDIWLTVTKLVDDNGKPNAIATTERDITKQKKYHNDLVLSEHRLKTVLKNSSIIVAHVDLDLRYTWTYNNHPDFDPALVIGKRDDEIDQNEGINQLMHLKQKVIDTGIGSRSRIEFPLSDGQNIFDVTAEPLKDENGQIIGLTTASIKIVE